MEKVRGAGGFLASVKKALFSRCVSGDEHFQRTGAGDADRSISCIIAVQFAGGLSGGGDGSSRHPDVFKTAAPPGMKAPLDCGHQEFPDDGSNGMPEYYCVQKAVTVVRFSKEVKRPAILASIAEDDGTAFQYPAFICGQGEARLFSIQTRAPAIT